MVRWLPAFEYLEAHCFLAGPAMSSGWVYIGAGTLKGREQLKQQ